MNINDLITEENEPIESSSPGYARVGSLKVPTPPFPFNQDIIIHPHQIKNCNVQMRESNTPWEVDGGMISDISVCGSITSAADVIDNKIKLGLQQAIKDLSPHLTGDSVEDFMSLREEFNKLSLKHETLQSNYISLLGSFNKFKDYMLKHCMTDELFDEKDFL